MKPPRERAGAAMGEEVSSRMTSSTRRMDRAARSPPVRRASRRAMTPPIVRPRSEQASTSWAASSNISGVETPGASVEADPGTSMKVALSTASSARTRGSTAGSGAPSVSKTEYARPPASVR